MIIEEYPLLQGEKKIVFSIPSYSHSQLNAQQLRVDVRYDTRRFARDGGNGTRTLAATAIPNSNRFEVDLPQNNAPNTVFINAGQTVNYVVRITGQQRSQNKYSLLQNFKILRPIVVGVMGDSFASGEGVSDWLIEIV